MWFYCPHCGAKLSTQRKFCDARCRQAYERAELREEFLKAYGGKCQCPGGCDVTTPEFLSLDHIHGGGDKHRKLTGTRGWRMYKLLRDQGWPKDKYRLLCFNCNMARNAFKVCPHEKIRRG